MDLRGKVRHALQNHDLSPLLLSVGATIVLFGVLSGRSYLWSASGAVLLPSGSYALVPGFFLIGAGLALARRMGVSPTLLPMGFVFGLLLVFFSDYICRSYSFFPGPTIRGEIILVGILATLALRFYPGTAIATFPAISAFVLAYLFFHESDGRLIFSDDHATFFYRLTLLRETFPNIPFYLPLWNGGLDARDFFATGALNVYLLFAPLIHWFPLENVYNLIVVAISFIILPLSVFVAARIERLGPVPAALASTLALSSGLVWYRWAFKYGTMGFATSAALLPLTYALVSKLLREDGKISRLEVVLSFLVITLTLFWSLSGIVFIPALLAFLLQCRTMLRSSTVRKLAALLMIFNIPWIILFLSVSNVGGFLTSEKKSPEVSTEKLMPPEVQGQREYRHRSSSLNLKKSLKVLKEGMLSTNPLIPFLVIPGIVLLSAGSRVLFGSTLLWLLFLGTVAVPLKPQLELDRMLLLASILGCIPAGMALHHIITSYGTHRLSLIQTPLIALTSGFLFLGPFVTGSVIQNRSLEQYSFADDTVLALRSAISKHIGAGRALFSGCVLHEWSAGHLAPLALWTGSPLIASSHVHDLWRYRDVIPGEFLARGDSGILDFLNLNNVSLVIAHDPAWREYFVARPAYFERVDQVGRFSFFTRKQYSPTYLLEGEGRVVSQGIDHIEIIPQTPALTIKFRYFPFLVSSTCTIVPKQVSQTIALIGLTGCKPGEAITIRSLSPLSRVNL